MTSEHNTSSASSQADVPLQHQYDTDSLTVFYDGKCPLCRREIGFYKKRRSLCDVAWVDVSICAENDIPAGLTRDQVLARFHIGLPDGSLRSGPVGFGEVWLRIKGFSWLGKVLQMNRLQPILELLYRGFLKLRGVLVKRMS